MKLRKSAETKKRPIRAETERPGKNKAPDDLSYWSELDKGLFFFLSILCLVSVALLLMLMIMYYRERFGVSTEFEKRSMDFMTEHYMM